MSETLGELEIAWRSRLVDDEDLAALVGSDSPFGVRVKRGWPKELLEDPKASKDRLPLISYFVPVRSRLSNVPASIRIQSDLWVWPLQDAASPANGADLLDAIDERMLELLGNESAVTWLDSDLGIHVSSAVLDGGDLPGYLLRRRRDWEVALA